MREDEEEAITYANNVTSDTFSLASSPQRKNSNAIFASEKLENSDCLVNTVAYTIIKDIGYKINAATASDTQVKFSSNTEKILTPATELLAKKY